MGGLTTALLSFGDVGCVCGCFRRSFMVAVLLLVLFALLFVFLFHGLQLDYWWQRGQGRRPVANGTRRMQPPRLEYENEYGGLRLAAKGPQQHYTSTEPGCASADECPSTGFDHLNQIYVTRDGAE